MNETRYKSFSEFWPFYLAEHSRPATRLLHLVGTTAGIALMVYLIATGRWWLFFLGFVPGYGCAWLAHFLVEKNKPATFKYPLWSLKADFVMWSKIARGTMDAEVERVLAAKRAAKTEATSQSAPSATPAS